MRFAANIWLGRAGRGCALALALGVGAPSFAAPAGPDPNAEAWASLQASQDVEALQAFADRKNNRFAGEARKRIRALDAAALPPPPAADPNLTLATMLTFDSVLRMREKPPEAALAVARDIPRTTPLPAQVTAPPQPVAQQVALQPTPVSTTPPAQPSPAQAPPADGSARLAMARTELQVQAPPTPSPLPPQPRGQAIRLQLSPAPQLPPPPSTTPGDPLTRPTMRAFDVPAPPTAFCEATAMYGYLTGVHQKLYEMALANSEDARKHMAELNRLYEAANAQTAPTPESQGSPPPGTLERATRVLDEAKAYKAEADWRFEVAQAILALDPQIRAIPVGALGGCDNGPWRSPTSVASKD